MKKKIMLVAAAAVLALSLVGCSKSGASAKKSDKLNISVFTIQQREQPPADNKTYKWIEEKFGVTFS
ncbi:MAG: hypothetical protein IKR45_04745, partial [Treponema sp.]|nr:hypothetical protein [Treponema sp.]